jgi:hypothetical protein
MLQHEELEFVGALAAAVFVNRHLSAGIVANGLRRAARALMANVDEERVKCDVCGGSGQCTECKGTSNGGQCFNCAGTGDCPQCQGTGKRRE